MTGTALVLVLVATVTTLTGCAHTPPSPPSCPTALPTRDGAVCRGPVTVPQWALVFTGHEFAEGGEFILDTLAARNLKASFFLTGDFLARPKFAPLVRRLLNEGHYLGPHSDRHLLYCTWDSARTTLVSRETFNRDLRANLEKIRSAGAPAPRLFLPPYEHNNLQIADWTREAGLQLVNFTPGTRSAADYTSEDAPNFASSQVILDSIYARERTDPHGFNGFILLLHLGTGPAREDKMHLRLPELLDSLAARGYECVRLDALIDPARAPVSP